MNELEIIERVEGENMGPVDIRPHRASVLGGVLASLGLDPGFDGPRIFGTRNTLSRVFAGDVPTKTTMLRELRPAADAAWDRSLFTGGMMSMPFLHLARRLVSLCDGKPGVAACMKKRMAAVDSIPLKARSWILRKPDLNTPELQAVIREGIASPISDKMPDGYRVRDTASLFAALARLAGWSTQDVVEVFDVEFGDARGFMNQGIEPPLEWYERVFAEIDAMDARYGRPNVRWDATPADVALHWQRYGAEVGSLSDDPIADPAKFPPAGFFDASGLVRE